MTSSENPNPNQATGPQLKKKSMNLAPLIATLYLALIAPDALLDAIEQVESSGRGAETPDGAAGEIGPLQIRAGYLQDANEWAGTSFTHEEMRDPHKARFVVVAYLDRWGTYYERETGRKSTMETLARQHNGGGPNGWRLKATEAYWRKVRKHLKEGE